MTKEQKKSITSLGADLRDTLNNPLQEIVAMVSIAREKHGATISPGDETLNVIGRAAKDIAAVVEQLEERMLKALDE